MDFSVGIDQSISRVQQAAQVCDYVEQLENEVHSLRAENFMLRLLDQFRRNGGIDCKKNSPKQRKKH